MEEEVEEWKMWAIEVLYKVMKKERTTRYLKLRRKYTDLKAKTKKIMKKWKAMIAWTKKKEEAKERTEKGQHGCNTENHLNCIIIICYAK